jgi:hypothetical protein
LLLWTCKIQRLQYINFIIYYIGMMWFICDHVIKFVNFWMTTYVFLPSYFIRTETVCIISVFNHWKMNVWVSVAQVFSGIRVARSLVIFHFLLTIVLSGLLWLTDSDFPFGIFRLFLRQTLTSIIPSAICQYHVEHKLLFHEMLMVSTLN